jgi:release factor glutamine methyltransferase
MGEPVAYILGRQSFWTLELTVSPATLIPRPETELLVEVLLDLLPVQGAIRVADLGTGSGAIAAALATERASWEILATDRSAAALAVARANLDRLGLSHVRLLEAHWLDAIAAGSLDAIVSNPPYVAESDPHLGRGDLVFEPRQALSPGGDGLAAFRAITAEAPRCLRPGGYLCLEHGWEQGPAVRDILSQVGFESVRTRVDLAGRDRITLAQTC